ncbi:MAG TPA: terminase family protein [Phycisphaerae bacterium]|nr:terminase family protein [Phycisphaerae bacterium]
MLELDHDILNNRYPLLAYQQRAVESTARFTWNCWSRQVGKSHAFALKRVRRGLHRNRLQVMLSAGERQSRELMQKVASFAKAAEKLAHYREVDSYLNGATYKQLEITLPTGARIIGLPANPDTARGFTGDVFLDEFGIHQDSRAIWAALFPTVLRGNGELDVASTPKGLDNMFAALRNNDRFERTTVTIEDAVGMGLAGIDIAELREAMGDEELFRQEFMCEFLDDSSAFLTHEEILGVMDAALPLPVRCTGDSIDEALALVESLAGEIDAFGWDIARRRDLSVIWLLRRVDGVLKTVGVIEMLDVPFRRQRELFNAIMAASSARGCIDATGIGNQLAEEAVEMFGTSRVEPVMFTLATKQELAEPLRVRTQDKGILIPATDAIRNDWHSIQRSVTGDRIRYKSERTKDGHADRFWSAALAVRAAGTPTGPAEYVGSDAKLAFARQGIW